jgi:23S rRNA-/tRNA-specific pseudouridylate synthase
MVKEGYVTISSTVGGAGGGASKVAKPATKTKPGDVINVFLPPPATCADIVSDAIPLAVLYEDDVIIVLNKQVN